MTDDTGRRASPWYLRVLAVFLAWCLWASGWISAWWYYIDRYK